MSQLLSCGSGNETSSRSGNETSSRSGNETSSGSGNETSSRSGNETSSRSGNETSSGSGNETSSRSGNETSSESGNETSSTQQWRMEWWQSLNRGWQVWQRAFDTTAELAMKEEMFLISLGEINMPPLCAHNSAEQWMEFLKFPPDQCITL